jgi:hypothetical protein
MFAGELGFNAVAALRGRRLLEEEEELVEPRSLLEVALRQEEEREEIVAIVLLPSALPVHLPKALGLWGPTSQGSDGQSGSV